MIPASADPKLVAAAIRVSRWLALGLIALGWAVLAGWVFGLPRLTTVHPGFASMKANTALLFILLGTGVRAAGEGGSGRVRLACALALSVIAALTGAQDLFDVDFGIDQLLIHVPPASGVPGGRMALATAVTFALLGCGLIFVGASRQERARDVFALLALALMSFALCGYIFGAPSMYQIGSFGSVALHTTLGLVLGSLALLAARPERGLSALLVSRSAAGVMLRRSAPFIALVPIVVSWLRLRGQLAGYYDTRLGIALTTVSMIGLLFGGALFIGASLERSERRRARVETDRAFLLELSELMTAQPEWEELGYQVTRRLALHLDLSRCVFTQNIEGERVRVHRDYCAAGESSLRGELELAQFSPESQAEYRAGTTVVVFDARTDPRTQAHYRSAYEPRGLRALVTVPFLRNGIWVASLAAITREVRAWKAEEIELIRLVGERAWSWVERLQVIEALQESEGRNMSLIGELSSAKSDLERRVVDRTAALSQSLAERDALLETRKRSAEHFRLAIEANPAGMLITDREGLIVLVNAQTEKLFGYTRAELEGASIELLLPEPLRKQHVSHRQSYFKQPKSRPMGGLPNLVGRHKDGRALHVDIQVNPMHTDAGDFALASIVDIGERRRAEAERAALTAQLQTSNTDLSLALEDRDTLLQEVHHRVKNNLQVVASLINMQMRVLDDALSRAALEECQARVLAIALIHEKLYQAKNYARVEFADYARSLAATVFQSHGTSNGIALELALEDVIFGVDLAIPCGLILNELITNALKHAFRDGHSGKIRVELARLPGDEIRLMVRDDGPGMPPDFDIKRSKSLGLQLIVSLSRQIGARIELEQSRGSGFVLTFPYRS